MADAKDQVTGWTIEQLPDKLRAYIDGSFEVSDSELMRMADEIERLRADAALGSVMRRILHVNDNGYEGYVFLGEMRSGQRRLTLDLSIVLTTDDFDALTEAADAPRPAS